MNADLFRAELSPFAAKELDVISFYEEIDSTNSEAMRGSGVAASDCRLVIAAQQSAGRGRRGRQWKSAVGAGIYMSLAWPTPHSPAQLQGLSLLVGLSLVQKLDSMGFPGLTLKWPNDVLSKNRKLAGILLELQTARESPYVVIGIGINIRLDAVSQAELARPVTDLTQIYREIHQGEENLPETEVIAAGLVSDLLEKLDQFSRSGFEAFQEAWIERDAYHGEKVLIVNGEATVEGVVRGVGAAGELILETDEGMRKIVGGELAPSLRVVEDGEA